MSNDDTRDDAPEPISDMTSFFAESAARAAEHAATCKAPVCHRCDRLQCRLCLGTFSAEGGSGEHCNQCRTAAYRKAWFPKATTDLPTDFAGTTLSQEWLSRLVGSQEVSKARNAVSVARAVAFVGPAGSGKTSLAIAMFNAALVADAPTAPSGWRMGSFPEGFGAEHLYVSAFDLANAKAETPLGKKTELIERAKRAPLVVIDELGGEDPRYASAVSEVIYKRHGDGRRTWITMGVRQREIATRYGGGIARKAFEHAVVFDLPGPR